MAGSTVVSNAEALDYFSASQALKLCASFEFRGYKGVGVARLKTGVDPEILSSDAGLFEFAKKLGVEVSDMRTAYLDELKPSNAQMFKMAEEKMIEAGSVDVEHAVKQNGPKLG